MAFLEDPRLRQRWNQIAHDAETATENAAAGIWSFQHNYINPCFGSIGHSIQQCTAVCLGDPEERRRRRREQERAAEVNFDFYDDWYEDEEQGGSGGFLGSWGGEDWDRLLAGTGSQRKQRVSDATEQPRRKRGMSYGTRGGRRISSGQDPTIIPSTQPIGFLSKLPWKVGGTLRYKPSAADLQEHPGKRVNPESEPLLGSDSSSDSDIPMPRKRSGTTGSGDTSDSYRSRGDLFPSDGEGEEDAVPLDDEVTFDMLKKDDRSSGKTRRSKGKRPAFGSSRTVSRTTIASTNSRDSLRQSRTPSDSLPATPGIEHVRSLEDLQKEEERLRHEEEEHIAKQKEAARQLAVEKGLKADSPDVQQYLESKPDVLEDERYPSIEVPEPRPAPRGETLLLRTEEPPSDSNAPPPPLQAHSAETESSSFVPARLPHFG
jgi:hypothetical protein